MDALIHARGLTKQFGPLPEQIQRRIEAAIDPARLEQAALQVSEMKSLAELVL